MAMIHLLTPAVYPGDAVSNDLLGMLRWLRTRGYRVEAYTGNCHRSLRKQLRPVRAYRDHLRARDDVLIYHHSVGWPAGLALYEQSRNLKVVKYHNVTPAAYYRYYNRGYARACRKGARDTRRLVSAGPELLLADSAFNARELVALGADPGACHTVPPFHGLGELDPLPLDDALAARLRQRCNLLFVGRLAPNKGHGHLIRALAHYVHYLARPAHLVLVGGFDHGLDDYREDLRYEIQRHRLQGLVHFPGKVSPRRLKTYYAHAQVFVCASEHEGFCVPLVEAMYYRIPIVAYGSGAIPQTLGGAGLVWETPAPAVLAESIRQIEEHADVREALVQSQWQRYQAHYTPAAIGRRLEEALSPLLFGAAVHA
jgi:glycosyltransferase involved in cell wall biosynthesis